MNYNKAFDYYCNLPASERIFISNCASAEISKLISKGKEVTPRQRRNRFTRAINFYAKHHGHENE